MPTVSYVLGLTSAKRSHDSSACRYINDSGLALAETALHDRSLSSQAVNERICTEAAEALEQQTLLNPRVRKPIWHSVISLAPEDVGSLSDRDWEEISEQFMTKMGFENCKWVATLHLDTENPHLHLVACTVQDLPGHPVVSRYKDYDRAERLMREFEHIYDLRPVEGPAHGISINHKERKPGKAAIRDVIDHSLNELRQKPSPDLHDFVQKLHTYGVNTRIQWRDGEPRGLSYDMDGWISSGSKLGAKGRYTLNGITDQGIGILNRAVFDQRHQLGGARADAQPSKPEITEASNIDQSKSMAALRCSRDVRIAISLPMSAAEKLVASDLIRRPAQIDRIGRDNVLEYRVTVSRSPADEEAFEKLISELVEAILRLIEQLLSLLGFNITLTPRSAFWAEDNFENWEAPDLTVTERPLFDQIAGELVPKEFETEIYSSRQKPFHGHSPIQNK